MADDQAVVFERERPRLLRIAYRMLGSRRDAEDIVQDAWLRWSAQDHAAIASPRAFLATLVSRACLDALRSAHHRRLEYVGEWLPEPLLDGEFDRFVADAESQLAVAEEISLALLLLLERLNPVERAVFVLRESLGFSYAEIAAVVDRSEENCRQIERRARKRLGDAQRSQPVPADAQERLLRGFLGAVHGGDVDGLVALLAADCVSIADGGGMPGVSRRPVLGALSVARFYVGLGRKAPPETSWRIAAVNGRPGILTYVGDRLHNVIAIDVADGRIARFMIVVNPEKLSAP